MTANQLRLLSGSATAICAVTATLALAPPAAAAPRVAGCTNVQDFAADPADNATDDAGPIRGAIAAALAAGGSRVVCLPGGTYNLLTPIAATQIMFDLAGATDLTIVGEGPGTVLQLGALTTPIQVFSLGNGAARIRFEDLVVDGSRQTLSAPATSLFRIGAGATTVADVTLEAVQALGSAGAGVVIDGASASTSITSVAIRSSRLAGNRGSAIKLLQGAERIVISGNDFTGNAGLDIEASEAARPITGLAITDNLIVHPTASSEPLAISLAGAAAAPSLDAILAHNLVLSGRVRVTQFQQLAITGNAIIGGPQATAAAELVIGNGARAITVTDNVIQRVTCTAGHVVQLGQPGDVLRTISLAGNALEQAATGAGCTAASAVQLAPASDVIVTGNHVGFAASAPGIVGISVGPATTTFSYLTVARNTIEGPTLGPAIELGGGGGAGGIGPQALIIDNIARGASAGVQIDATSAAYIPRIANNRFDGAMIDIVRATSNPAVAIRGNLTGLSHFTGTGSPETRITAPVGALYLQTDATSHGLWVKESGTGNVGWLAKN